MNKDFRGFWRSVSVVFLIFLFRLDPSALTSSYDQHEYHEILSIGRGTINHAAWRPDGRAFAVSGSEGVWVYTDSFEDIVHLEGKYDNLVVWSPDGRKLASTRFKEDGTQDNKISVWDVETAQLLHTLEADEYVVSVAWSRDGTQLAAGGFKKLWLWDAASGTQVSALPMEEYVRCISWSPDESKLALADGSTIKIWNVDSKRFSLTFNTQRAINEITWSPDSTRIATSTGNVYDPSTLDNSLRIWNAATGELLSVIQAGLILTVGWSPDGKMLATGTGGYPDNSVQVWDASTGELLARMVHMRPVQSVNWSSDSSKLLSAGQDNIVQIWDVSRQRPEYGAPMWRSNALQGHSGGISSLAWSPDGTQVASASSDGSVRIWDSEVGTPLTAFRDYFSVLSVTWSPDGQFLASGRGDNKVVVTDLSGNNQGFTGLHERPPLGQGIPDGVSAVAWSPDGQFLASGGYDGTVLIWSMDATRMERLLNTFEGSEAGIQAVAWSPDSKRVAGVGNILRVWDIPTEKLILEYKCLRCTAVSWSPDGTKLAINLERGELGYAIVLLDAATGEAINIWTIVGPRPQGVTWSPDGSKLAAFQTNNVNIWDATSGEIVATIDQPNIRALAWNPNSKSIAAGDSDGVIHIWEES